MDLNRQDGVNALAEKLKDLLARFADKDGVSVLFHKTEPRMRFNWKSDDGIGCTIDYDINQTSEEYINNMISALMIKFDAHRKKRHESPIIIASTIPSQGVH
ncbi:hypothetical protein A3765_28470 [Oleiphilus sp. HI0130]|nr:hypothetical protein A3765_28815 [Oleiphilus sp. HI0130]KZZ72487.1 hypothetical protein A3765_28470 [Oleiphilus sp. HI0130]